MRRAGSPLHQVRDDHHTSGVYRRQHKPISGHKTGNSTMSMVNSRSLSILTLMLVGFSCKEPPVKDLSPGDSIEFKIDFPNSTFSNSGVEGAMLYPHFTIENQSSESVFSYYGGLYAVRIDTSRSSIQLRFCVRKTPGTTIYGYVYPTIFKVNAYTALEFYDQINLDEFDLQIPRGLWDITGSIAYFRDTSVLEVYDPYNHELRDQLDQHQTVIFSTPTTMLVY